MSERNTRGVFVVCACVCCGPGARAPRSGEKKNLSITASTPLEERYFLLVE